jgi:hypothetical protein
MLNFVLILIGAVGLFLAISAAFGFFRPSEAKILATGGKVLKEISLKGKMETLLRQAHAPISVREFVTISLAIGAGLAVATYLVAGGLIVPCVLFFCGGVIYYLYLIERRDKYMLKYEEAMPLVTIIIREYLRVHGTNLVGALEEITHEGPKLVQQDFWDLSAAFQHPANIDMEIINKILTYRNSPGLAKIIELLLSYSGTEISMITKALDELQVTIQKEADIASENAANVMGPKRNLMIICAIVLFVTAFLIISSPIFRQVYASTIGQIVLLAVLAMTAGAYVIGSRATSKASMARPYVIKYPEQRVQAAPRRTLEH